MMDFKSFFSEKLILNREKVELWFQSQARETPPPFYSSVDLRDSGHKVVPVDCNIYPAGFNNICPDDARAASAIFREKVRSFFSQRALPFPSRILLLSESHTQNLYYLENLHSLLRIIEEAGFEVRLGRMQEPLLLKTQTGKELVAHAVEITRGVLSAGGFTPEMILLNNDFSGGYPDHLDNVVQPILPSHAMGWHSRRKADHFKHYNDLAGHLSELLEMDPWPLRIETEEVDPVDFSQEHGIERLIESTRRVLEKTRDAYSRHEVNRTPFVFIKNNSGTYGMGIMVVHSHEELLSLNRRTKNKMSRGKDRHPIQSVIVQEGIPTATLVDRLPAEPVIYLFGDEWVGGFLRTHSERGSEDNLNSPGMVFKKLCMSDLRDAERAEDQAPLQMEWVYGTVARLSALAAGRELSLLMKNRARIKP